jgi:4-alpha-glucanotransferase
VRQRSRDGVLLEADGRVRVDGRDHPVAATKAIRIDGGRLHPTLALEVTLTNRGSTPLAGRLAIEWSTVLLGGGGNPAAWQEIAGQRAAHDAVLTGEDAEAMAAGNDHLGIRIDTTVDAPASIWTAPIETVSNSEAGFELVYQGSCMVISRRVTIAPGGSASIALEHRVTVATDLREATRATATPTLAPMTVG